MGKASHFGTGLNQACFHEYSDHCSHQKACIIYLTHWSIPILDVWLTLMSNLYQVNQCYGYLFAILMQEGQCPWHQTFIMICKRSLQKDSVKKYYLSSRGPAGIVVKMQAKFVFRTFPHAKICNPQYLSREKMCIQSSPCFVGHMTSTYPQNSCCIEMIVLSQKVLSAAMDQTSHEHVIVRFAQDK